MKIFYFKKIALVLMAVFSLIACKKIEPMTTHHIIPEPLSVMASGGKFEINKNTKIRISGEDLKEVSEHLQRFVQSAAGLKLTMEEGADENVIALDIDPDAVGNPEGYVLDISEDMIRISSPTPSGIFYGIQSLRQLLPVASADGVSSILLPTGKIEDSPEYGYRGAMLDVARHFFSVEDVKHYIDLISMYKLNMLHLHLSDDQGWRIEIKSWPLLTTIGGSTEVGGGMGGFYTQEDYKEIVAYAQSRFITIVPEIDMPGHTNSALAAYGVLNPGITVPEEGRLEVDRVILGITEADPKASALYTGIAVGFSTLDTDAEIVYQFVDDVVREISAITPGPYFHIGGDESHVTEMEDYIPFIEKAQAIVSKYGKTTIGWDEIAHADLQPSSIVQFWAKGENAKLAVDQGAKVLMSPATRVYLDMQYDSTTVLGLHWAAYIELDDAYNWEPTELVEGIGKKDIVGVEAPLWTETITNRAELEYMVFPRISAIAEVAWTPQNLRNWDSYANKLKKHGKRWDAMGINYYKSSLVDWEEKAQEEEN